MPDQTHSPEPWVIESNYYKDDEDEYHDIVYFGGDHVISKYTAVSEPDARRIVACVNFLRGVPTEVIERWIADGVRVKPKSVDWGSGIDWSSAYEPPPSD